MGVVRATDEIMGILLGFLIFQFQKHGHSHVTGSPVWYYVTFVPQGETALHHAIIAGDLAKVKLLIEEGCDIDKGSEVGITTANLTT